MSKYVIKKIMIEFANPKLKASAYLPQIREAAKHASANLKARHDILLGIPQCIDGYVLVNCQVPTEIVSDWSAGNHLRGIAAYLLKNYLSKDDRVGNRLLHYIEVPLNYRNPVQTVPDKFSIVFALIRCLNAPDSADDVKKIHNILKYY